MFSEQWLYIGIFLIIAPVFPIIALVFLIFDVETVFLFPWAVAFGQLPLFAVLEGALFILILVAGLLYSWRKGVLEWI
jgi:NADH-quinone oxidoreductase subunit A